MCLSPSDTVYTSCGRVKTPAVRPPVSFASLNRDHDTFHSSTKRLRSSITIINHREGGLGNNRVRWSWQTRLLLRSVRGTDNHRHTHTALVTLVTVAFLKQPLLFFCFFMFSWTLFSSSGASQQSKVLQVSIQTDQKRRYSLFISWKSSQKLLIWNQVLVTRSTAQKHPKDVFFF